MSGYLTTGGLPGRPRRRPGTAVGRPQWRRALGWVLAVQLYLAAWFWLIAVAVVTVALIVIDRIGTVTVSIMQFASEGATWFPFAIAIISATAQLSVHVANGMTRRSFIRAALVTSVVSGVVYALVMSLAMLAEGAVFARFGWPHVAGADDVALWQSGFGPGLLGYALLFVGAQVSGLLVGIGYYRYGGWWGTLLLPLTAAPAVLLQLLTPLLGGDGWFVDAAPFSLSTAALAVPGAVVVIALGAAGFHRLTRDVAIRRVTT
ncbi:hypothetical protein [Georgenia faecalis]|uniref:ABC transporter permease n=1 Tax=Georgenia faecalis TaxID=2483799 RepID=A0ABV9DBG1_9MICO|nr:hypothetical protein [Georgenia faecalis]